jgi:hypothetical protein
MTNLIFATWGQGRFSNERYKEFCSRGLEVGVHKILGTIVYPREIDRCIYYGSLKPKTMTCWLDSGAFSLWKTGEVKTVKTYEQELKETIPRLLEVFAKVYVISLDRIPGTCGTPPTPQDLIDATNISVDNFHYLLDRGIKTIPVHHQGEPFDVLKNYFQHVDYIGVSPANDAPRPKRVRYVQQCWQVYKELGLTNPVFPAHSFGNTATEILQAFPFYSADSQTWGTGALYGKQTRIDHLGIYRETESKEASTLGRTSKVALTMEAVKNWLKYERHIQSVWKHRNITWNEPAGVLL